MAIIENCETNGVCPHGYEIWRSLQQHFHTYMDNRSLRNVYHHLRNLEDRDLIVRTVDNGGNGILPRCLYSLTARGRQQRGTFEKFLEVCNSSH